MADKYFVFVIEEMDRLWFHQIILFSSEPTAKSAPKPFVEGKKAVFPISESFSLLPDDETSTDESSPSPQKKVSPDSSSEALQLFLLHKDGSTMNNNKGEKKERLARMNVLCNRIRSHSSSPSSHQHYCDRKFRKPSSITTRKLQKSMSCKTLGELELDEVKGFMDLGFIFKKETLSPRMMSVVPGLQRLGLHQNKHNTTQLKNYATESVGDTESTEAEEEEEKRDIIRPYLSEAWLIKRPDSPLLSLKIPKACSASNMKKLLRFWAKTVASEINQE